jgi:hypothetical protein
MAEWHNVRYKIVWNQDTESTQMPPWQSPSRLVYIHDPKLKMMFGAKKKLDNFMAGPPIIVANSI